MSSETGLRERKKQQTRSAIAEAAARLFAAGGFDAVTVADVAREAQVSVGTVFNYFPAKEDLFYGRMQDFGVALVDAVRERPTGESVLAAFRRFVLDGTDGLADAERADAIATAMRTVSESPALRAREREIVARSTRALAELITEETGSAAGDVEPHVVANALIGAQQALVAYVHEAVLAGARGRALARQARSAGERAFAPLERGLADYAVQGGCATRPGRTARRRA
jgi:AcrR family transcriptional regulator